MIYITASHLGRDSSVANDKTQVRRDSGTNRKYIQEELTGQIRKDAVFAQVGVDHPARYPTPGSDWPCGFLGLGIPTSS